MDDDKISKGVRMLEEQGHHVQRHFRHGKMWWEIDGQMRATAEEIEHLADGVYSVEELVGLFIKRRLEELGQ